MPFIDHLLCCAFWSYDPPFIDEDTSPRMTHLLSDKIGIHPRLVNTLQLTQSYRAEFKMLCPFCSKEVSKTGYSQPCRMQRVHEFG